VGALEFDCIHNNKNICAFPLSPSPSKRLEVVGYTYYVDSRIGLCKLGHHYRRRRYYYIIKLCVQQESMGKAILDWKRWKSRRAEMVKSEYASFPVDALMYTENED